MQGSRLEYIRNAILAAVKRAGEVMLSPGDFDIERKGDHDYVTACDKAVQALLIEELSQCAPEASFVSEELDNADMEGALSGACFVIDPIDGTHNFMNGMPICAISVAYAEAGVPLAGAVHNPFSAETFHAVAGDGAAYLDERGRLPGTRRRLSGQDAEMAYGLLLVEDGWHADKEQARKWFLGTRALGSAALNICFVAAGRAHSYMSMPLHSWDYAAAALVAKEAGMAVCDGEGSPIERVAPTSTVMVGRAGDMPVLVEVRRACEEGYRGKDRRLPRDGR